MTLVVGLGGKGVIRRGIPEEDVHIIPQQPLADLGDDSPDIEVHRGGQAPGELQGKAVPDAEHGQFLVGAASEEGLLDAHACYVASRGMRRKSTLDAGTIVSPFPST